MRHASDAIILADEQGNVVETNRQAEKLLGYTGKPLSRMNINMIHPDEEHRRVIRAFKVILRKGFGTLNDTRVVRKDGRVVPVDITGSTIDFHGRKILQGLFRDISNRKHDEELLHKAHDDLERRVKKRTKELTAANQQLSHQITESAEAQQILNRHRELLQTIIDQIPVMLCFFNSDMKIRLLNREFERVIGWSLEDARQIDVLALSSPDPAFRRRLWDFINEATSEWQDIELRTREGSALCSWRIVRLSDGTGIAIGIDITRRKQAEEALRESEERFRVAEELSPDGFSILRSLRESDGAITDFEWEYANPAALQMLWATPEDLIGNRLCEVFSNSEQLASIFHSYVKVVETGKPHESDFRVKSGATSTWYRNMAVKLGDGLAVFFTNITKRKQMEETLRRERDESGKQPDEEIPEKKVQDMRLCGRDHPRDRNL